MSADPAISVVVPTYQRRERVGGALDRLEAQRPDVPFEVVVVDNGSTDGTTELLADRAGGRVRVLRLDDNRGPGPARNAGWRAARAPIVAFTDDDCAPAPGWLDGLNAAFAGGADVVTGPTLPVPEQWHRAGPFSHWVRVEAPTAWFETCNVAYRRELLAALDGFDESFTERHGAAFGDDTDLGWRALEAGADVRWQPEAVVHHAVTRSDWGAWLRARRRRAGVPEEMARHPGLRLQLPRWWLYQRPHLLAVGVAAGLGMLAARPRSPAARLGAAAAVWRYVADRRMRLRDWGVDGGRNPVVLAGHLAADLVEAGVVVANALRARVALL